jgi:hypothetical protein
VADFSFHPLIHRLHLVPAQNCLSEREAHPSASQISSRFPSFLLGLHTSPGYQARGFSAKLVSYSEVWGVGRQIVEVVGIKSCN